MSKQIDAGGPAFPCGADEFTRDGTSLRDWFAGQAAGHYWLICEQCLANDQRDDGPTFKEIATSAYKLADAMIAARKAGS